MAHAGLWTLQIPDWAEDAFAGLGLRLGDDDLEITFGGDLTPRIKGVIKDLLDQRDHELRQDELARLEAA